MQLQGMGKGMEDKGVLRSGVDWFSHQFKKIFKRDSREELPRSNLEQLYRKYQQQSRKLPESSGRVNLVYKKKSEILEMTLKKLRRKNQVSPNQEKIQWQSIKQETLNKMSNGEKPFDLNCPICLEVFILPVPTVCGHTFCSRCIEDSLLHKPGCPVCRTPLRTFELSICLSVKTLISIFYDAMIQNEDKQYYNERMKEGEEWEYKRKIYVDNLVEGEKLDVRDTEYIWCVGHILKIYRADGKASQILVHYLGWNKIYDQILDIKSPRLAPFGFYSTRKEIPRYASSESEQNYYSYVVTGTQLEQQAQQQEQLNNQLVVVEDNVSSNENSQIVDQSNDQTNIQRQFPEEQPIVNNVQQLIQTLQSSNLNIFQEIIGLFQNYGILNIEREEIQLHREYNGEGSSIQPQYSQENQEENQEQPDPDSNHQ